MDRPSMPGQNVRAHLRAALDSDLVGLMTPGERALVAALLHGLDERVGSSDPYPPLPSRDKWGDIVVIDSTHRETTTQDMKDAFGVCAPDDPEAPWTAIGLGADELTGEQWRLAVAAPRLLAACEDVLRCAYEENDPSAVDFDAVRHAVADALGDS